MLAKKSPLIWTVGLLSIAISSTTWGFSEDICYYYKNPTDKTGPINPAPFNCWDLQCRDGATSQAPNTASSCVVTGLARYADATFGGFHARNSIHFDITWLSARLHGMKEQDALKLAMFTEATDLGSYQHYDYQGFPMTGAVSDNINGVVRTNLATNGFWLHFVPWKKANGSTQNSSELTYTPNTGSASPYPAQEVPLAHLRAWAFGLQKDLCEFGMTDTQEAIGNCLKSNTLYYDLPILAGPNNVVDIRIQPKEQPMLLGWQRINQTTADCDTRDCYNRDYASVKAGTIEALGIYLHAMGDRISHHYCSDESYISNIWTGEGTPKTPADYYLFYPDICGTAAHVSLHYPETGQAALPERSRDAVNYAYQEIAAWMAGRNYVPELITPTRGFPTPTSTDAVNVLMDRALTSGTASERLHNLCNIALQGYQLKWHDQNPDCTYSSELDLPQAGSIAGINVGKISTYGLTGMLRPAKDHQNNSGDLVIVARTKENQWFSLTPAGFSPSLNGVLTAYQNGKFDLKTVTILNGSVDLTLYKDAEIYMGYGSSLADIITNQRYSKIGVIR